MLIVSLASVEEQMEQAAVAYSDLLDGKDKPVVGSTCEYRDIQMTFLTHIILIVAAIF